MTWRYRNKLNWIKASYEREPHLFELFGGFNQYANAVLLDLLYETSVLIQRLKCFIWGVAFFKYDPMMVIMWAAYVSQQYNEGLENVQELKQHILSIASEKQKYVTDPPVTPAHPPETR